MRVKIAISFVTFAAALGQAQSSADQRVDRVLYFADTATKQGVQEMVNIVRAVSEMPVTPDLEQRTLAIHGTVNQVALAEWVFNELDQPPSGRPVATYAYSLANGASEAVRILYFAHPETPQHIQERVNTIRAITEITRMMPDFEKGAIVMRGSADRVELAEWIFAELDKPAAGRASPIREYRLPPATGSDRAEIARIFFLSHSTKLQDIVNAVRRATQITRVMPQAEQNAIVSRATEEQMAQASQIIQQLDME
jgi:type II secretory pathway component GspD/PulD (secretin)